MGRLLPMVAVTLFAAAFVALNRGEMVVVNLGVVRYYRAPVTVVAFLSFLVGMLAMFALSLRHDLRVRRTLRERAMLDAQMVTERTQARESKDASARSPAFDLADGGGEDFPR